MYFDEELGPYIPAANIEACLRDGGKFEKRGEDFKRGVQVIPDKVMLEYPGPRALEPLWKKGYVDIRGVVLSGRRVMRSRPKFRGWWIIFPLAYDPAIFDRGDLVRCAELAGRYTGLGDYTPRFGRFDVEAINGK
jgi:hypothetical protein